MDRFTQNSEGHLTALRPTLTHVHPDDAFSSVPYEKGSAFLFYLETLLGGPGKLVWVTGGGCEYLSMIIQLSAFDHVSVRVSGLVNNYIICIWCVACALLPLMLLTMFRFTG